MMTNYIIALSPIRIHAIGALDSGVISKAMRCWGGPDGGVFRISSHRAARLRIMDRNRTFSEIIVADKVSR